MVKLEACHAATAGALLAELQPPHELLEAALRLGEPHFVAGHPVDQERFALAVVAHIVHEVRRPEVFARRMPPQARTTQPPDFDRKLDKRLTERNENELPKQSQEANLQT